MLSENGGLVMTEKRTLVREVVNCTPDCEHSSKGLETIEVEIHWINGKADEKLTGIYYAAGSWTLLPEPTAAVQPQATAEMKQG